MLRKVTNISMHGIVGTSLLVIALLGSGGAIAILFHAIPMTLRFASWSSMATAIGIIAGRKPFVRPTNTDGVRGNPYLRHTRVEHESHRILMMRRDSRSSMRYPNVKFADK
ncbi:hypothetical protein R69749_07482 [Paraburkholderia domus]|nr:hypothetical protein R70006_08107 [Paraburkholderia domus]CAE6888772.1 hypothetical protein R69749_07482 [Paraburkholderia domus]CAE6967264.1 hypothetical protein R70199_07827 [Paraburkholderia domus]